MSIIQSLQSWLSEFNGMELLTDTTDEAAPSHALAAVGGGTAFVDILGNRVYQNSYVFYAKEHISNEMDRQDNQDFFEELCEWIEEKNDAEDFPKLSGRYTVSKVEVANPMLMEVYEDGLGLYQVQIQLYFEKVGSKV